MEPSLPNLVEKSPVIDRANKWRELLVKDVLHIHLSTQDLALQWRCRAETSWLLASQLSRLSTWNHTHHYLSAMFLCLHTITFSTAMNHMHIMWNTLPVYINVLDFVRFFHVGHVGQKTKSWLKCLWSLPFWLEDNWPVKKEREHDCTDVDYNHLDDLLSFKIMYTNIVCTFNDGCIRKRHLIGCVQHGFSLISFLFLNFNPDY